MTDELHAALRQYFGFDDFLDYQREVVEAVMSGGDYCVIMPTGAGKSLCYQLPLLLKPGYGIVVSPLIALMKDQIDALRGRHIPAGAINSAIDYSEQRETLRAAAAGEIKLLYVAPERFSAESFTRFLEMNPPSTLIVDEAHCISQWGHDFRPAYTRLGVVAERFGIPQVCAFTATATPRVRDDIKLQLGRENMRFHVAGFKRPNLAFKVIECRGNSAKDEALAQLLKTPVPGATIIYAATRKQVDELTSRVHCLGYHAGMTDDERTQVQEEFMTAAAPVLAATNAFGMGIDRADVRRVIHYNLTGSLEAYYQEAGRAGRDGEPADCILFFSYADRYVQEFLVDMSNPATDLLKRLYRELVRLNKVGGGGPLEVSARDLAARLDVKNDSHIYNALRVLEHYNVIVRGARSDKAGVLQLRGNATLLEQMHAPEKNQRSRFIHRFLREYGLAAAQPTFTELVQLTGLGYEQLRRVLHFLNGDVLAWTPAPSGGTIELAHPEMAELEIDFSELERKRGFEMGRLDDVVSYARTRDCRQAALIGYFGEKSDSWKCGGCDNCDAAARLAVRPAHQLSDTEIDAATSMLQCVGRFNGRFGRGKISLVLTGARRTEILDIGLGESEFFGVLRAWKQDEVLDYLRALEKAGYLETTPGDYPCLMLSNAGEAYLDAPGAIQLNLRGPSCTERSTRSGRTNRTPPEIRQQQRAAKRFEQRQTAITEAVDAGTLDRRLLERADLLEELREMRYAMAKKRHLKPFQIFPDATLHDLVLKMPVTEEECAQVKGVGPTRARTVLPEFLDSIRRYRRENLL